MKKPTADDKLKVIKKILASMKADYEHTDRKMGRKSWKTIADFFYTQTSSLEDLINDKGFLYGLLCDEQDKE